VPGGGAAASDGAGDDARPVIVFLHATRLTGAQWSSQIADLSPEFRCLAPDLPGHGRARDATFTLEAATRAAADVIEREAGGRAIVVGLSLGGYVAMDLAARRPELVSGLVVAGATAEPHGPTAVPFRGLGRLYGAAPLSWLERQQARTFRRYPASISDPILADGFWFRAGADAVRSIVGESFRPRLASYPGPSLLVNGQRDLLFRLAEPSFAAVASDARRLVIPGAGHRSNLDRPRSFSAAVRSFARQIGAAAT
jgi:pimeloyl-ACP methyl ester carboxylesterase